MDYGLVGLVSIFFALMGSAIEPRTPYWLPNGMTGFYLPKFLKGEFAKSQDWVFSPDLFTRDSVAFNLGKLIGLHAQWQLLPLYAIWLGGAIWLARALPKNDARKLIGITAGVHRGALITANISAVSSVGFTTGKGASRGENGWLIPACTAHRNRLIALAP